MIAGRLRDGATGLAASRGHRGPLTVEAVAGALAQAARELGRKPLRGRPRVRVPHPAAVG